MLPDRVSNPGPLICESGALPIALRGPAAKILPSDLFICICNIFRYTVDSRYLEVEGTI